MQPIPVDTLMCYRGGNCDGSCEATVLHQHECAVTGCGFVDTCTGIDCPDNVLCTQHADFKCCDWCHEWFSQLDGGGYCAECAVELAREDIDAEDFACADADAQNKDEEES